MPGRWPLWPTLLVASAIVVMLALGWWQWTKAPLKDAAVATWRANLGQPPVALPRMGPIPRELLYRRTRATCLEPVSFRVVGGNAADGRAGFRLLADCRTGAEGPGFVADLGVADPDASRDWAGGEVEGVLVEEPVAYGLLDRLSGKPEPVARAMIVASTPAPGRTATAPPDPSDVPNNHRAYAWQWLFFALAAAVIYVLALRQRDGRAAKESEADPPAPTTSPRT